MKLPRGVALLQFHPAEALRLFLFAKIDALQAAGIHHRRIAAFVQVLMLVDVTERHVIPRPVAQHALQHGHIASDHHTALRAIRRARNGEVPGQDRGQRRIELFGQRADVIADDVLQRLVQFLDRFTAMLGLRQQAIAHGIRRGGHLHLAALRLDHVQRLLPTRRSRSARPACDRCRCCWLSSPSRADRDCPPASPPAHCASTKRFTRRANSRCNVGLGSRVLKASPAKITRSTVVAQAVVDHFVEAAQKIDHAAVDAGAGIDVSVSFPCRCECRQSARR